MQIKIRSKAPLRIGLAGGGTDISPFSDMHGGCVLNATINQYAHCTLEEHTNNTVSFHSKDIEVDFIADAQKSYPLDGVLSLHKAVYNRIVRQFNNNRALNVKVTTWTDVPMGSGLGTSSTIVVAILSAYREYLKLPLGEYDLAHLAFEIERIDCGFSGGKQDQYAATFGGFNFIEIFKDDKIIVNPLRIRDSTIDELESRFLLYYTGLPRESARIIDDQINSVKDPNSKSLGAMFELKNSAIHMKEALLKADINRMVQIVREGWEAKKSTSTSISNPYIDKIISVAEASGVQALKLSGAGGGGFMLMCIEPEDRCQYIKKFAEFSGHFVKFEFTREGERSWII